MAPKVNAPVQRALRPGRTVAWLAKQVELGLADSGLSLPQYRILGVLDDGGRAVSSAVARRLAVRPPSLTGLVDGLVARGLVARTNDEEDRRCVSLEVTPRGRQVLREADQAVDARLAALAGALGPEEAGSAVDGLGRWSLALAAQRDALAATR